MPPKKLADNRKSGHAFERQMEALREMRGESEWVMKVTDKWGQRERGCYLVREQKSRHSGWWGWQTNAGGKEKEYVSRQDKEQT